MGIEEDYLANEDLRLYGDIGVPATVLPVHERADAERQLNADALASCSLIFMHGGYADWLVDTFKDTPVWQAILDAVARGVSLAATSGGIMCLGGKVPRFSEDRNDSGWTSFGWVRGLGLLPGAVISSHWDSEDFAFLRAPFEKLPPDERVVAVDERTVMIGDGTNWTAAGEGTVHVIQHGSDCVYRDGDRFEARLS
jgi:cyanophycinase-like exopeptidase